LQVTITPSQCWYIEGANGAGKTSLLRILAGLSPPSDGHIEWQGKVLGRQRHHFYQNMIYVGHKTGLNRELSAIENVMYWASLNQVHMTSAYDVLGELGLIGLEDLPVGQLSEGQQRRVALTRLWIKKALIWVLDEPYAALDVTGIALLNNKIDDFIEKGGSVVMTSHQEPELRTLIHRLVLAYRL
jgi:heme exporter protein A